MNLSKVKQFENKALVVLGMLQRASGFMLIVGMMAIAQSASIAIFFANIFSMKITSQLANLISSSDAWVIHLISGAFGIVAGLVIETGSFFFSVNGMRKSSYFSATVSGILSIASYHSIFYGNEINLLLGFGIFVLGFYPSLFIMIASHQLAERFSNDAQAFTNVSPTTASDTLTNSKEAKTTVKSGASAEFEVIKKSLIS
ncbi:hypothetical protein [Flammeovirga pacifica]|uniref:Uncharacterized protein n=1 Tax=Flammeovirga pacifica TaxID=915059 RepID=A0A1S1Z288_FLAPC|nr:hypothetical protein [Flammeovirga pacifica]OHX67352.1 hypothetical protein NH26_13875 [Flammeovirga pacifica]